MDPLCYQCRQFKVDHSNTIQCYKTKKYQESLKVTGDSCGLPCVWCSGHLHRAASIAMDTSPKVRHLHGMHNAEAARSPQFSKKSPSVGGLEMTDTATLQICNSCIHSGPTKDTFEDSHIPHHLGGILPLPPRILAPILGAGGRAAGRLCTRGASSATRAPPCLGAEAPVPGSRREQRPLVRVWPSASERTRTPSGTLNARTND